MALFLNNRIIIAAPIEDVWDALINPEKTKQYMYGCETVSDWQVGSALLWQAEQEGAIMVFVKGHILRINAPHHLTYTVIDPHANIDDNAENYLTVTYDLEAQADGQTELKVTQGDYDLVAEGSRRYAESNATGEGWLPILRGIKALVEA